jgi:SulP family sulfate permease
VAIFRIHGPFLFGATDKINDVIARIPELPPIVILRLRNMTALVHQSGQGLLLCGARQQPAETMRAADFAEHVGTENICPHVQNALERAKKLWTLWTDEGAETSAWKAAVLVVKS